VILFERSVEVGDFLDFGTDRGTIKKIGLRASIVETVEKKQIIVPNSQLVNDRVYNWSGKSISTRFEVSVGVAYGSDTQLVKNVLLEAAALTSQVQKEPKPFVRFVGFGDSSLDFELLFYTKRIRYVEDVKSDLRFTIDGLFRTNKIEIPFPQKDVWIKQIPARDTDQASGTDS